MRLLTAGLALAALVVAAALTDRARRWNDELALASPPLARAALRAGDPATPRLTRRVVLVIIDGLGADEARLPYLDELRRRGVAATARVPYPTISRPNYVTILTGVPPRDSGVRVNRVSAPVAVDTVMDRVRDAGLRVASASDFGMLGSLFLRHTESITGVEWVEHGAQLAPPPPIGWPFDDVRRTDSLDALGPILAELAAGAAAFIPVLVLDVDRAGHADGVGREYRAAAAAVDRMLRTAFAAVDLVHDTVIVTADHGHVAPGGHGGDEPEVSHVPLILAGAGVVPGAVARDARLIDLAPTVAALLGVPAPRHAEGRALVELLALSPSDATRRRADDDGRARALTAITSAALADAGGPAPGRLVAVAAGLAAAAALAGFGRRRGAFAVTPGSLVGALGFAVALFAVAVLTRGQLSPSYVPTLARTERFGALGLALAIALQILASRRIVRRAADRLAAARGIALVGPGLALTVVGLVRAWFSPPYLVVPPPFWMVATPAVDLAAAACALAAAITLVLASATAPQRAPQ